jgi:hypothetical protein
MRRRAERLKPIVDIEKLSRLQSNLPTIAGHQEDLMYTQYDRAPTPETEDAKVRRVRSLCVSVVKLCCVRIW